MSKFSSESRTEYWTTFPLVTDKSDFIYHLAGADIDVSGGVSEHHMISYRYRFLYEDELLRTIIEDFNLSKESVVLDAGCGTGRGSLVLKQMFEGVDAFDISEKMIVENSQRFSGEGINFFTSTFSSISSKSEKYDVIFVGGVFMCMSDNEVSDALVAIRKMLKPRGKLIVRDTIAKSDGHGSEVKRIRTEVEEIELLKNSRFNVEGIFNGANRMFLLSTTSHLPELVVKVVVRLPKITSIIGYFARRNARKEARDRNYSRHELSNQLYFVCNY